MNLKKRIATIAYKNKLGHLGSYFSSLEIIDMGFRIIDVGQLNIDFENGIQYCHPCL